MIVSDRFSICPLCGSDYKIIYKNQNGNIAQCLSPTCTLVFVIDQPSQSILDNYYDELYYPKSVLIKRPAKSNSDAGKFEQHLANLQKKIDLENKNFLDFGCGIGNFMQVAKKLNIQKCTGLEFNNTARQIARNRGLEVVKCVDDLTDHMYDFVYMNDVIEHLRDPVDTLIQIRKKMNYQGSLFVITMNINGLKSRILKEKWSLIQDPTHFFFYNRTSLKATLINAGFKNITDEVFSIRFSHHSFIRNILQKVLIKTKLDTGLKMLANNSTRFK